jgi:hypothetical protein
LQLVGHLETFVSCPDAVESDIFYFFSIKTHVDAPEITRSKCDKMKAVSTEPTLGTRLSKAARLVILRWLNIAGIGV